MKLIAKYFPGLSPTQLEQFQLFSRLFKEWNQQINLVSRKDIDQLEERHILHSLAIARIVSFRKHAQVLDIGTGGGFPGIPLAIMFPETSFYLTDSIRKKIKVVEHIKQELTLTNVQTEQIRAEKVTSSYDFIISRAVAPLPKMLSWCKKNIKREHNHDLKNGFLALKGGDLSEEFKGYENQIRVFSIAGFFKEEYFQTKKILYYSPFL